MGPAGPVRLESKVDWPRRLLVSGPGIPWVRIDRVETRRERTHREKRAAKGKSARPVDSDSRPGMGPFTVADTFSRNREALALTVNGSPAELAPRRVFLIRAGYGVRAEAAGRRYLLSQTWWFRARVLRDGRRVARLRRVRGGKLPYEDAVRWDAHADPLDLAMTHALATAYRVGSPGLLYNVTAGIWYTTIFLVSLLG